MWSTSIPGRLSSRSPDRRRSTYKSLDRVQTSGATSQLGQRITERRKARGITQVELAKTLGIAQQTMAHYEGGTVRIAIATLALVAKALDVAIEDLIGTRAAKAAGKRGPAPKIQQQLERIDALPKA